MENERGIFGVPIFRYLIEKLIYNDEYSKIDKNLDDSNVGARKDRNIRDNIFVLNSILKLVLFLIMYTPLTPHPFSSSFSWIASASYVRSRAISKPAQKTVLVALSAIDILGS